jgi:probable F420-dependent oxidoreductase
MSVELGRVGVWTGRLQRSATDQARDRTAEWDELGFGALWVPESPAGKDVLTFATVLLGATRRMVLATGIANIWVRDPIAMASARRTIGDAYPGRFVLGVGVSHASTALMRGHHYANPLETMRSYLAAMNDAPFDGLTPADDPPTVVAALGPKMITAAGELADGIHPFLTSPEHTAHARTILGDGKIIAVEQGVILTTDAADAREAARTNLARYLRWPNYRNHFRRSGYDEDELAAGGSDRLLEAVYAIGEVAEIKDRVDEHLASGADHVAVQVIDGGLDEAAALRELAPALLD